MARGHDGSFGGKAINSYPGLARSVRALPRSGLRISGARLSLRNLDLARPAVPLRLALVLQRRPDLHERAARLPGARSTCSPASAWIGWRGRAAPASRPVWPVWLLIGATVFVMGFRVGLDIADSNVIDVGYAGVIGAQRIASGQAAVRPLPAGGRYAVRAARPRRAADVPDPAERPLRVGQRPRGHVWPGRLRGVPSRVPRSRLEGEGRPAERGALHVDPLRLRLPDRARARRVALRRQEARGDARVRVGRVSVHAVRRELELERRDPGGAARVRVLARIFCLGAGWPVRPGGLDEVLLARAVSALAHLSAARTSAAGCRVRRWRSPSRRSRRSRSSSSMGIRSALCRRSGTARSRAR